MAATALCSAATSSADSKPTPATAHHKAAKSSRHKKSHKVISRKRGQQKIDAERATQIQQALIREHYMSGTPSGVWDSATQNAMQNYQADNGWQSKTTPDARALIKLGLGPDQQHLLNPESAMTSQPLPAHPTGSTQNSAVDPPPSRPQK